MESYPGDDLEIVEEVEGGSTLGNEDQEYIEHQNVILEDITLVNHAEQVPLQENKRKKVSSSSVVKKKSSKKENKC